MREEDLERERARTWPFARAFIGEGHDEEPLRDYVAFMTTFLCLNGAAIAALHRSGRRVERPGAVDLLLLGLATNRLSRLVTREKVTRVIRAPFTDVDADAGPEEVREHPRGVGLMRGFGELLTCPLCVAMWGASALSWTYVRAPSVARVAATILSAATISDYVNARYAALREREATPAS